MLMARFNMYMEPEGGPLSWYSTMKNINDVSDRNFNQNSPLPMSKVKSLYKKALKPKKVTERPGIIGLGMAPKETGAEILKETEKAFKTMLLIGGMSLAGIYVYRNYL